MAEPALDNVPTVPNDARQHPCCLALGPHCSRSHLLCRLVHQRPMGSERKDERRLVAHQASCCRTARRGRRVDPQPDAISLTQKHAYSPFSFEPHALNGILIHFCSARPDICATSGSTDQAGQTQERSIGDLVAQHGLQYKYYI